jgi:GMP synthase (glutamine-hydrolysing)
MGKVLVFQHVANEILGTLNPSLKNEGLSIRYVNFDRNPDDAPSVKKYHGLIILGGHMGVYEAEQYTHIKVEMKLIEQALAKEIPILGICLGAQILAHVLGADVRKSPEKEIGWYDIDMTSEALEDPLFKHFKPRERIFQLHGDTFDIPKTAVPLASSKICPGQAFRYGDKAYGLQFHLEVDKAMIYRWLENPINMKAMDESGGQFSSTSIQADTEKYLPNSIALSQKTFQSFIDLFPKKQKRVLLGSR